MKQLTRSSMSTTVIHYPTRHIMRMTMKKRQEHMMMWRLRKRLKKMRTLYMTRKKEMKIMMKLKQRQKLRGTSVCTVDTNCTNDPDLPDRPDRSDLEFQKPS